MHKLVKTRVILSVSFLSLALSGVYAQAPKPAAGLKPYADVVKGAKSDPGIFTVHRIDDRILFEIPKAQLGREMLVNIELQGTVSEFGYYGGQALNHRVVRWTRRGNSIQIRQPNYDVRSEGQGAIVRAVEAANVEPIVATFPVEAEGPDGSAVIDVTRFFTGDITGFAVKDALGGGMLDPARTFVDRAKAFPQNVEVVSNLTLVGGRPHPDLMNSLAGFQGGKNPGAVTALVHYSLVMLPEKPMMPRFADKRLNYLTEPFESYGGAENRAVTREYILRYRLEKKDPSAALSEPVKPIVYYISREVPEWLHPYFKKAVEDWNPAFEAAGFKNAIVCKEAPTVEEDPTWDPEDVRYSVIRWAPTELSNAMGPHINDPRTGEILSAHILVWQNVLKIAELWYFSQVGDMDPRAAKLPLSHEVMGRIMQYVVSHEVGHTLGLKHNHKASSSYTVAQLRDKDFTARYGDEASIMDYGRFNYVAQPGDGAALVPIQGPYDSFTIEWGYKPLGAASPEAEKPELDRIAARQVTNPMLRYGGEDTATQADPTVQTEDLSNDPVEATRLGLLNLDRIAKMLIPATTHPGGTYDMLSDAYDSLWSQRGREMGHVAKLIGGIVETRNFAGRGDSDFAPAPLEKQAQAMKFLLDNVFTTPKSLILPEVLQRVGTSDGQEKVLASQSDILNRLTDAGFVGRLDDAAAIWPGKTYTLNRLLTELQAGIWSELNAPAPKIDIYRRNLQRYYYGIIEARLKPSPYSNAPVSTSFPTVAKAKLRDLKAQIAMALPKTKDSDTRCHLEDMQVKIDRFLNPVVAKK